MINEGWILASVLIGFFGLIAVGHAYCLIRYFTKHVRFSVVPLLGGVLGALGFYVAPAVALQKLWWLPLLIDYGSVPSVISWAYTSVNGTRE